MSRRSPLPSGQARPHWGVQRSRAAARGSARAVPNRPCSASRAANRAGGSGSWPAALQAASSSAMPGRDISTLRLASEREGSARIRPKASISSSSSSESPPPPARASTAWHNSTWPASQRAKGSLSAASRCTSSAVGRPISSSTGAENWRSRDRAGGWCWRGKPTRRRLCSGWSITSRRVPAPFGVAAAGSPSNCTGRGSPAWSSRPKARGITRGCLSLWPGVAGVCCCTSSSSTPVSPSQWRWMCSRGVPAW